MGLKQKQAIAQKVIDAGVGMSAIGGHSVAQNVIRWGDRISGEIVGRGFMTFES